MNFSQKQIMIIGGAAFLIVVIAVLVFLNMQPAKNAPVQLTVWGFDKSDAVGGLTTAYSQFRPNVKVTYKEVSRDDYENMLLSALASGQGPDVFPVHNRALSKKINILSPAEEQFTSDQVQNLFPTEVSQDFVISSGATAPQAYALPLYLDTLSLIYNKDLFDQGGVVNPPTTWEEFQNDVAKLRNISSNGQITRAGAAIGGSRKTVGNAVDLLNVLMLQNGVAMTSGKTAAFASETGFGAFNFYLQFTNPASPYYTWNDSQQKDIDGFSAGKTAMIFGYTSDVQKIKKKNPFLRFGVASLPQINASNAVNYADYWGLAVSKQSPQPSWAWDFVVFMATQPQIAAQYSSVTGQPPALREIINQKINDATLGVSAKQSLTARSWRQPDENRVNEIINNAIVSVLTNQSDSRKAITQAQDQISQFMNQQ